MRRNSKRLSFMRLRSRVTIVRCGSAAAKALRLSWLFDTEKVQNVLRVSWAFNA